MAVRDTIDGGDDFLAKFDHIRRSLRRKNARIGQITLLGCHKGNIGIIIVNHRGLPLRVGVRNKHSKLEAAGLRHLPPCLLPI